MFVKIGFVNAKLFVLKIEVESYQFQSDTIIRAEEYLVPV